MGLISTYAHDPLAASVSAFKLPRYSLEGDPLLSEAFQDQLERSTSSRKMTNLAVLFMIVEESFKASKFEQNRKVTSNIWREMNFCIYNCVHIDTVRPKVNC